jgi:hypothetical protein
LLDNSFFKKLELKKNEKSMKWYSYWSFIY